MYVITINNPYYPSVEYRDTLAEARQRRDEIAREKQSADGAHVCKVTIARVIETGEIRTDF